MRVGLGAAWATVVAAELIAAQEGLGYRMQQAQIYYDLWAGRSRSGLVACDIRADRSPGGTRISHATSPDLLRPAHHLRRHPRDRHFRSAHGPHPADDRVEADLLAGAPMNQRAKVSAMSDHKIQRSEERRVGRERKPWGAPEHEDGGRGD